MLNRQYVSPLIRGGRCVVAAVLLASASAAQAITISGILTTNAIWATNNNPYVVQGTYSITNGIRLTISPGVRIQFQPNSSITCRGSLLAQGSSNSFITFTRNNATGYSGYVNIMGSGPTGSLSATGTFRYCRFSYLSNTVAVIGPTNAAFRLEDCSISNIPYTVCKPYDSDLVIVGNTTTNTGEAINAVRCRGIIASNRIYRIVGYADAIDLDFAWVGPGEDSILVAYNVMVNGSDVNADGIDLGTSLLSQVIGNKIVGFNDKGLSIGEESFAELYNNLVVDCNTGIGIKDGSSPILANNTVVGCNYGIRSYEKSFGRGGGRGSFSNSIIWNCDVPIDLQDNSTLDVGYSIVNSLAIWPGPGNSNADPEFADEATANYRLLPGSPAFNTGVSQAWMSATLDVDGNSRIIGAAPDRGAYEFIATQLVCNVTANPRVGPAPFQAVLIATVDGPSTNDITYFWDTDNNGTNDMIGMTLSTVTSAYSTIGFHSLKLTVSNSLGTTATAVKTNYITVAGPSNIYVSLTGSHVYPYTNWTTASTSIHAAVNAGFAGSVITLGSGTYYLATEVWVDRDVTITGLPGAVVDGQGSTRCFKLLSLYSTLDSLTIQNGYTATNGGGVYFNGGIIQNCTLFNNSAGLDGGAAYIFQSGRISNSVLRANNAIRDGGGALINQAGTIVSTVVMSNTAMRNGGGIFLSDGGTVENSTILGNVATNALYGKGGGMFFEQAGTTSSNVIMQNLAHEGAGVYINSGGSIQLSDVASNTATLQAGGVMMDGDGAILNSRICGNQTILDDGGGVFMIMDGWAENCLIYGNTSADKGGGLYIVTNGVALNCTIVDNHAWGGGGGMRLNQGGQVYNSIIYWNNAGISGSNYLTAGSPTIAACCTEPFLAGNISADPGLVNVASRDFHLTATSPCIDTATSGWFTSVDYDLTTRPLDGDNNSTPVHDIGAFEYIHSIADSDGDLTPDEWEIQFGLDPTVANSTEDEDVDGQSNWDEYLADTDPDDADSSFEITGLSWTNGRAVVLWKGGVLAQQTLLRSTNLATPLASWLAVTNVPSPTPTSNTFNDASTSTGRVYYYRLKASRN